MTRKFSALAKLARERYQDTQEPDMTVLGTTNNTVTAPPKAKKAPYLRDADGNVYLWTEELAERGDLVAAYDPNQPDKYADDQSQIALNRELELARERADAEEAARLQAVRDAEAAEAAKREAEEVASANERSLRLAEETLQTEREEHAKQLAELQAKMDAMAKEVAKSAGLVKPTEEVETVEAPKKKSTPKKRAPKVEEVSNVEDLETEGLDEFDQ